MTQDEAVEQLNAMVGGSDQEIEHGNADDLLCAFLRSNGNEVVAEAYERAAARVGFWYA